MKHVEESAQNKKYFKVGFIDRFSGKPTELIVLADNADDATHKVSSGLFGYNGYYEWTGTGPVYTDNEIMTPYNAVEVL